MFQQPQMRYKARTDLERIFDVVNKNSYGKMSKNVLKANLKKFEPDEQKKEDKDDDYEHTEADQNHPDTDRSKKDKDVKIDSKVLHTKQVMKKELKNKHVDNSSARMLMKELYYKTHFKAASQYIINGNPEAKLSKDIKFNNLKKSQNNNHSIKLIEDYRKIIFPTNDEAENQDFLSVYI